MSNRRGHKHKPKAPPHKRNGARIKDERLAGSSRGSESTKSALGVTDDKDTPTGDTSSWGKGKVLSNIENPSEVKKDLSLIGRALRGRWNIPDERKRDMQERLYKVLNKEEVTIEGKNGPMTMDEPADRNAVSAIKVLVQMHGQDLEADQFDVKNKKPPEPQAPGTVVNVYGNESASQPGPSPILQLAISLGARELIIDGSAVPVTDSIRKSKEA